jgi:galactonate dehydratase
MKISRLETFHVRPRWLILRVHTDTGLSGLGEATLEGASLTVETMLREMARWLIGQDPRRIEHIWQHLYRGGFYRGGPVHCSALSGVDMALWDLLGKSLGAPVFQLLGGRVRDRVRMYAWTDAGTADDYVNSVKTLRDTRGLTAFKYNATGMMRPLSAPAALQAAVDRLGALRQAAGPHVDIGADFHGRLAFADAKRLVKLLEPHQPMFIEEPILPGDADALREIADSTHIPIAAGERLFTRWQFRELVEKRAVRIVQPDIAHAGGISEVRRIAAMAESSDILIAPHCPLGPVALAASLQLDAACPNFAIQEPA